VISSALQRLGARGPGGHREYHGKLPGFRRRGYNGSMRAALAILAAGRATRFGRPKALEPVGPSGEALFEYAVYDAIRAGCDRVVFVIRPGTGDVFRSQALARFGTSIPIDFVQQRLDALPPGFRPPPGREAPWGTGHAVLTLAETIREPFVVLNADDFYGPGIIERLVHRLRDARTTGDPSHFLAGYEVAETPVSSSGGVNRAVCTVDASLVLQVIEEIRDIRPVQRGYVGTDASGEERSLKPEDLCSMNLWAFQPGVFERLAESFARWHARLRDPLVDEFLLSESMGELVGTGRARVRVVPAEQHAYGMTFPDDLEAVRSGVATAVAVGHYPIDLAAWFEGRAGSVPG